MKYIHFLLLIFAQTILLCQNTFELKIKTELDDLAVDIIQHSDGNYFFLGNRTDNLQYQSNGIIYKIDPEGEIINSIEIRKKDTIVFLDLIDTINGKIVACGRIMELIQSQYYSSIFLVYFNSELQIISEKIIKRPTEYSHVFDRMMKIDENKIFIAGDARHIDYQKYHYDLFLYELNAAGDSIKANFTLRTGTQFAEGYLLLKNNEGHFIFSTGVWGYPPGQTYGYIAMYDGDLNWIKTDTLPCDILIDNYAMNLPSGGYLVSGRQWFDTSPGIIGGEEMRSVLYNMQRPNIPVNSYEYHMGTDTLSMPAVLRSFDTTNTGAIYFSGTANVIAREYPYQDDPSWIFLSKLDENMNHQWTRFYGGDMFYHIYTVKATEDDGAIMACTTFDYNTQYLEHDILILKVDENGLITSTGDELSQVHAQDAIVYP
nr:hypothetical protein [Bacteroidota bacterium]